MKKLIVPAAAVAALLASGLALAQGSLATPPSDLIAVRKAGFDLQSGVAAAMKAAVEGNEEVKGLTAGAKGIAAWARIIPVVFPAGSEGGPDSKAKSEIWSDRAGFEKAAVTLATAADRLAQLADAGDKPGFAAQFKVVGEACGGCHRPYRAK